jgi:basic membrane protein A
VPESESVTGESMIQLKRASVWAIGVASALVIAGCSSTTNNSEAASCSDSDTFCIGLVLEAGVVNDGAFNEAAWEGVQEAAAATGGVAEYLESTDSDSYSANLAELAARGFDVVVASAVARPDATIAAATKYPATRFIGISQDMSDGPANTTGLIYRDDEAGYAAGYLAGLMTRTGVVGAVLGSEDVIPLKRFGEGYRLGAKTARPGATVIMSYNNNSADSFNDPSWGSETAAQQVADGADIVFGAGGTTGIAALETVAGEPGAGVSLFCIGIDVDQYYTVPQARPCLLSSAEKRIASGVRGVVIGIHSGVELDRNVEGEIGLAPYHDLESQVPNNVQQEMDAVVAGLIDGSIATGVNFSSRSS